MNRESVQTPEYSRLWKQKEATYQVCKDADAVLFSAVGDPKFDNDPTA